MCMHKMMITCILLALVKVVSSNLTMDKKECKDQLQPLTPCLSYVSGESAFPDPRCCINLRANFNSTKKCLCKFVKDRNDPDLGLKILPFSAIMLPSICHLHSNASHCIDLLGLAPNSVDAIIFSPYQEIVQDLSGSSISGGLDPGILVWCLMLTFTLLLI